MSAPVLRLAMVLGTTEDSCDVMTDDGRAAVPYASFFPAPRVGRMAPGHLVALAGPADAPEVVWRWFDAVVVEQSGDEVGLWEPGHGLVRATPREAQQKYRPGTRAYASAGMPGAEWWVTGPVVDRGSDAHVDRAEVVSFLSGFGLLE